MHIRRILKNAAVTIGSIGALTLLGGGLFEVTARRHVAQQFPSPGHMVHFINGRRLQMDCRGSGSPTVVLESGLDNFGSLAWVSVHDSIAKRYRVCAYSRAGILWSDPTDGPFDSGTAMTDLHAALLASGSPSPWVMVGHSLGGPYVTTFTSLYPDEVIGIVFVDATHPDQFQKVAEAIGQSIMPSPTEARIGATIAWTGAVRLLIPPDSSGPWPDALAVMASAFLPNSLGALTREMEAIPLTLKRAGAARNLGDRPVIVLASGRMSSASELAAMRLTPEQGRRLLAIHLQLAVEMSTWSSCGDWQVVNDASHYIQFDRPELIVHAIKMVVGQNTVCRR